MKERFEGPDHTQLLEAVRRQEIAGGSREIAESLVSAGKVHEFAQGDRLITENGPDNDVYLLVAGSVGVVIKGNEIGRRKAGQHVGEMSALEPAQPRSASVIALETVVAVKVSSSEFMRVGEAHPQIWLPIARELSRRLYERNKLIAAPNESPKLFIISSTEALPVARRIRKGLEPDVFSKVWDEGVFFAGGYSLESLEKAVEESDFAVAIAQPDDLVTSRGRRSPTLRDNVLFELGLFMGKLTRHRAVLVHPRVKNLKLPSDLQGLTLVSYEPCKPRQLPAHLAPVCAHIRAIVQRLGVRRMFTT